MAGIGYVYPPPADGKPFRLVMGLRSMPAQSWIEGGPDLATQLAQRQQLISTKRDVVFRTLSDYESPSLRFAEMILENLKEFHSDRYLVNQSGAVRHLETGFEVNIHEDHPFLQLAKVISEDLCLISRVNNQWLLTSAAVIFPSRWQLAAKIGRNLDEIHAPVPGYDISLQPAMNLTFDRLTPERQVWRLNWALHADHELHQPTAERVSADPSQYWWRTERQTLTKLAGGDHVLFTIRNRAEPLANLLADPIHAASFAETLSSMSPATIEYKGLSQDHQAIVDYLISR